MTKEQIIENNKMIAEFMDGILIVPKNKEYESYYKWYQDIEKTLVKKSVTISKLQYYSSWDWLMPVVEKISSLSLRVGRINTKIVTLSREPYCRMDARGVAFRNSAGYGYNNTLLQATYKTVVDFLIWYNNNVKKDG